MSAFHDYDDDTQELILADATYTEPDSYVFCTMVYMNIFALYQIIQNSRIAKYVCNLSAHGVVFRSIISPGLCAIHALGLFWNFRLQVSVCDAAMRERSVGT